MKPLRPAQVFSLCLISGVLACVGPEGGGGYTRPDPAPPDPCESFYRTHRDFALVVPPRPCKTREDCSGAIDGGTCLTSYECVVPNTMSEGTCVVGLQGCHSPEAPCTGTACCSKDFTEKNGTPTGVCIPPGQFGLTCR